MSKHLVCIFIVACSVLSQLRAQGPPYQTMGIKIGEVTQNSAIIWMRLNLHPTRIGSYGQMPTVSYKNPETGDWERKASGRPDMQPKVEFPPGTTVETIEGAVRGIDGEVRVSYKEDDNGDWVKTDWLDVEPFKDYTRQVTLSGLQEDKTYLVLAESRSRNGQAGQAVEGRFRTAASIERPQRVVFTVSTGQAYNDMDLPDQGYKIYAQMRKLSPSFFVHTGDILYYDRLAKTEALARWHWQRMYSLPTNVEFHNNVASYFIKDDHDTWRNDCWLGQKSLFMGEFTFTEGQAIFREQVPMGDLTYRTVRWGKDLQIWLVEGRDFRSPNPSPDGPEKTIWGKEQKTWFKETVKASDATFRILISPTPLVGPDRDKKNDNHSNAGFTHEGNELREFLASQDNMVVVCGDRHWQYVSQDKKTGLREYSCGPASNEHAGGWKNEYLRPEHKYLNVTGGFLAVTIDRTEGKPTAIFRHYSVDGEVLNEDVLRY